MSEEVHKIYGGSYVKNRNGIFEYILDSSTDTKLLNVRVFDEATKKSVYTKQTKRAKTSGKSNCSQCAIRHNANKKNFGDFQKWTQIILMLGAKVARQI